MSRAPTLHNHNRHRIAGFFLNSSTLLPHPEKSEKKGKDPGPLSFLSATRSFGRAKSPKQTERSMEVQSPIAEPSSHAPKQTTKVQLERLVAEPGPPSQPPKRSPLCLCCVIEGEDIVFSVDVPASAHVTVLKREIQSERAMGTLQGVGPHILELWKVCVFE